jgi:DNA-binding Xre family transcriptional regulator
MAKEYTLGNRTSAFIDIIGIDEVTGHNILSIISIENKIPRKIADYRDTHGCSIKWIAKQLRMSTQNLYKIFDSQNITLLTLIKISTFLQCNVDDLYSYSVTTELMAQD